ncbi:coenzyme F420-0:L-glutamate ligase [Bdellovibrio bacteriovorus]|uniref:coenzyme F420-0:L-glutamate ligase n=1 Tax=Bdellovibrio TaxID=958 RepID=UPI0035A85C03
MTKSMMISPIQTSVFHQGDDLVEFIIKHVDAALLHERSILVITSKIVSLAEGCLVPLNSIDKKSLIKREADVYLGEIGHGVSLTIKHGLLVAAAGIDESNSENGDYIVYPKDPYASAENLRKGLMKRLGLRELGVILTDSRTGPLRLGVVGVSLSYAGFHPLRNMIGQNDIFGRPLKMTKINLTDSLAAAAVLMMGEAAEKCPLAVIQNPPVEFTDTPARSDLEVSPSEDMYLPLYQHLMK